MLSQLETRAEQQWPGFVATPIAHHMCLSPLDAAPGPRETWHGSVQKTSSHKNAAASFPGRKIMPKRNSSTDPARRNFLKGATLAGAAALATRPAAANTPIAGIPAERSKAEPPGPQLAAAETMPPTPDTA